jgi:drug/metabolite transporter (DMT)-like permease
MAMTSAAGRDDAPRRLQRPLAGILFMCMASTLFPIMNGLVQVLSARYPAEQIVWARTGVHLLFVLALFMPRFGPTIALTTRPGTQILRSLLLMGSTVCFFTALRYLPLAQAASISFTAPLIVTLLAWPLIGERISLARLAAVMLGFAGVLIVIRPGSDVFHPASLLVVASATFYGLYQIYTRKVAGQDRPETSAVYSALIGTGVMGLAAYSSWVTPQSWTDVGLLCSLGILGGLGHYCVARAMTYAQASILAPFQYWQMVGSVAIGYLISGMLPDAYTWLGSAVIVVAGLLIGWRETRERR